MTKSKLHHKIDWLQLEQDIRKNLQALNGSPTLENAALVLTNIDGLLGDATGRGYSLPGDSFEDTVEWLETAFRNQ